MSARSSKDPTKRDASCLRGVGEPGAPCGCHLPSETQGSRWARQAAPDNPALSATLADVAALAARALQELPAARGVDVDAPLGAVEARERQAGEVVGLAAHPGERTRVTDLGEANPGVE